MTDKNKPFDIEAQDSVQSYLDLLLSKPTENADSSSTVEHRVDHSVEAPAKGNEIPESKNRTSDDARALLETKSRLNPQLQRSTKDGVVFDDLEPANRRTLPLSAQIQVKHLTPVQRFTPTLRRKRDYIDFQDDVEPRSFARPVQNPLLNLPLPKVQPAAPIAPLLPPIDARQTVYLDTATPLSSVGAIDEIVLEAPKDLSEAVSGLNKLYPSWAQQRFECLLFTVCGLTLAVPLTELGAIYPLTEELTPIFGQVDWFLGLLPVKDRNIRVINTAKVVMPERFDEKALNQFKYVITINGVDWGLAAEGVSSSISLDPENIKWRGKRSRRPWLAGTVVEHMCALLDVNQLTLMFVGQDK